MKVFLKTFLCLLVLMGVSSFNNLTAADTIGSVSGTYKAILNFEESKYFQYAQITIRTVNMGGELKLAANVKVFYGDSNSNEFLVYKFSNVQMNLVTSQIVFSEDTNDLTLVGFLRAGKIEGDWYSSLVGKVGSFLAAKNEYPAITEGGINIQPLTGFYKGNIKNTNPQANLPERLTLSFVSSPDFSGGTPSLKVTGSARLYLGDFDSLEYIEIEFDSVQYNPYSRFLVAKTKSNGFTFKGVLSQEGLFEGVVLSDALGLVGSFKVDRLIK